MPQLSKPLNWLQPSRSRNSNSRQRYVPPIRSDKGNFFAARADQPTSDDSSCILHAHAHACAAQLASSCWAALQACTASNPGQLAKIAEEPWTTRQGPWTARQRRVVQGPGRFETARQNYTSSEFVEKIQFTAA